MASLISLFIASVVTNVIAGAPMGEDAAKVLCGRILEGDAGAIDVLTDYLANTVISAWISAMLLACGLAVFSIGEIRAKDAMKKANDEKIRILEKEGPE